MLHDNNWRLLPLPFLLDISVTYDAVLFQAGCFSILVTIDGQNGQILSLA